MKHQIRFKKFPFYEQQREEWIMPDENIKKEENRQISITSNSQFTELVYQQHTKINQNSEPFLHTLRTKVDNIHNISRTYIWQNDVSPERKERTGGKLRPKLTLNWTAEIFFPHIYLLRWRMISLCASCQSFLVNVENGKSNFNFRWMTKSCQL